MSWFVLGGVLLLINAAAHVVSAVQIRSADGPAQEFVGVSVFAVVYAVLGVLMLAEVSWAPWVTIAFSVVGLGGLVSSWNTSSAPMTTNRAILGLDVVGVIVALIAGLS